MTTLPRHGRRLAAVVLITALMLVTWAARWGWADVHAMTAREQMAQWQAQKRAADTAESARAIAALQRARQLDPTDADHAVDLGRLHETRAQREPDSHHTRQSRGMAIEYFREALRQRPAWNRAWAYLAVSKVRHDGLDAEAQRAISRAVTLGPWDKTVQKEIAWIGFRAGDGLPAELQAVVADNLTRSLRVQVRAIIDMAVQFSQEERLRARLLRDADKAYLDRKIRQRDRALESRDAT